jgi:dTDP-4-dehydrorhamnose reductase
MKVAIFGIGFLGSKLMEFFSKKFEVVGADINSRNSLVKELDATNEKEIEDCLTIEKPDIVIDTIALASYFVCENNHELCKKLNYDTAKNIAETCEKINAKMIFISSSYVFDGEKGNYSETDATNPTNEYARLKIRAEKKVLELKNSIVIRTEPLYGFDKEKNQIKAGTNTFESDVKNGYPDILRSPVFIDDVPKIILSLIEKNQKGIFHIAGPKKMKWLDILKRLAALINAEDKVIIVDNSNWILKPPHDSSLDTSKIASLGIETTSFEMALEELRKLVTNNVSNS